MRMLSPSASPRLPADSNSRAEPPRSPSPHRNGRHPSERPPSSPPSPRTTLPPLHSLAKDDYEPKAHGITYIDARPPGPHVTPVVPYPYQPSPFYVEQNHWYHHQPVFGGPRPPSPEYHPSYMPHRVESTSDSRMSRHADDRNHYDHPSPPPIATLHHSPAPSGGSSISSPSPPLQQGQQYYAQPGTAMHPAAYPYPPPAMNAAYPSDGRHQPYPPPDQHIPGASLSTRAIRPAYVPTQSYPGQANYVIHTDDAATKLSDRVRRKCYNCRTTDTSTWRRSSLTPGKVLCNKCGLFERTHSRPRPEQFPHKRGPIVTSSFKSRTTPPAPSSGRLPSMNTQQPQQQHQLPPHHYDHPSIAPLMSSRGDSQSSYASNGSLPDVRNLLNGPSSPGQDQPSQSQQQQQESQSQSQSQQEASQGESSEQSASSVPQKRSASPLPRTSPTQSPRTEARSPPYAYRTSS
ncbi:hypothetical protein EIP91_005838 [Steccherinum ochraceum]|uniref:GATA-type domain-containing protein n=1 Tax=Steccherinum ochraceum TaxID=92696 RepID=A0A4R0RCN5_9APHY|nr:hypothetical protein EIP91_005838 [Steccherinum ochraceum]